MADRFGLGPWYVNDNRTIWVGWGSGPPWVKGMNKKVMWIKPRDTYLKISGRRLDADAGPLGRPGMGDYSSSGFHPTSLFFPTEGCWEVTGEAGDASLTFVTLVGKVKEEG